MKNALLPFTCAASVAFTTALLAQTPQTGATQSSQPARTQSSTSGQQTPAATGQPVTLTGCVYEASDEPNTFALRRMNSTTETATGGQRGASTSAGAANATSGRADAQQDSRATTGQAGAQATGTAGSGAAASADASTDGAIYRLAASATDNIKMYVGRRVQISGRVTPGRDEKGVDVIIHRIEPDRTVVTAVDLKPAPQLEIASISPMEGTCTSTAQRGR